MNHICCYIIGTQTQMQLFYKPPLNSKGWYAPETLFWIIVLMIGACLLFLALHLAANWVKHLNGKNSKKQHDKQAEEESLNPLEQLIAQICLTSAIVGAACGKIVFVYGHYDALSEHMFFNTTAGLPAAALMLLMPSISVVVACLVMGGIAKKCPQWLNDRKIHICLWLMALSVSFAFFGMIYMGSGAFFAAKMDWIISGSIFVIVLYILLRFARNRNLPLVELHREPEGRTRNCTQRVSGHIPNHGLYKGINPFFYWAGLLAGFVAPTVVILGLSAIEGMKSINDGLSPSSTWLISLCAGIIVAIILGIRKARVSRYVKWDKTGIEVAWYLGNAKKLDWNELAEIKPIQADKYFEGASIKLISGEVFIISQRYDQYDELLALLNSRIS